MDLQTEGKVYEWMREVNDPSDENEYYFNDKDEFVIENPNNPGVNLLDTFKDERTIKEEERREKKRQEEL